jgi:DNA-binding transcriptional ArsR family regulator
MTNRRIEIAPFSPLARLVETAKALAHPTRLRLLAMLRGGELCACQLVAALGQPASTVSGQLSILRRAGLVQERRDGKLVYYRLVETPAEQDLLAPLLGALEPDPVAAGDAALVGRLREVAVPDLCAAGLDLAAVGVVRIGAPSEAAARTAARPGGGT